MVQQCSIEQLQQVSFAGKHTGRACLSSVMHVNGAFLAAWQTGSRAWIPLQAEEPPQW